MGLLQSVTEYVEGDLNLEVLSQELHAATWASAPDAHDMRVVEVRSLVSEATSADWPQDELKASLMFLLRRWGYVLPSYRSNLRDIDTYEGARRVLEVAINMGDSPVQWWDPGSTGGEDVTDQLPPDRLIVQPL